MSARRPFSARALVTKIKWPHRGQRNYLEGEGTLRHSGGRDYFHSPDWCLGGNTAEKFCQLLHGPQRDNQWLMNDLRFCRGSAAT